MASGIINKVLTIDEIYPVGSVYISVNSTSPATLFGGTWTQITGRFLIATGNPGNNTNNYFGTIKAPTGWTTFAKDKGGEDYHTLSINEMPAHTHPNNGGWGAGAANGAKWRVDQNSPNNSWGSVGSTGGGTYHNNMPPYFSVNMWYRTA